ncbi:unnamed protein product [Amoebophrya sp. A120]|nr:unnamed protein product [Amoebophrya sp. A120]|eukprot:GSA120T00000371001.1
MASLEEEQGEAAKMNEGGAMLAEPPPACDGKTEDTTGRLQNEHESLEDLALRPEVRARGIEILTQLEDFCAEPGFTEAVTQYFLQHGRKFDDREDDFPLDWYTCYQQYCLLMESLLEPFDACSGEELELVCQLFLRQLEGECPLMCSDYLLATLDYEDFVRVAQDHKRLLFGDDMDEQNEDHLLHAHGGGSDVLFPPEDGGRGTTVGSKLREQHSRGGARSRNAAGRIIALQPGGDGEQDGITGENCSTSSLMVEHNDGLSSVGAQDSCSSAAEPNLDDVT